MTTSCTRRSSGLSRPALIIMLIKALQTLSITVTSAAQMIAAQAQELLQELGPIRFYAGIKIYA
jgi:hypothetical protein